MGCQATPSGRRRRPGVFGRGQAFGVRMRPPSVASSDSSPASPWSQGRTLAALMELVEARDGIWNDNRLLRLLAEHPHADRSRPDGFRPVT
ncbi:hypothetical protein GCM10010388_50480 [Streptomyces mauvecolor]